MTALAVRRPAAPTHAFTGTARLLALNLRLDRVRIAIWVLALGGLAAGVVPALARQYPDAASRQARAQLMQTPSAMLMGGPAYGMDDYTIGVMVANELSLSMIVAVAIMSILLTVRHTRAEEDSGRAELIRAGVVGANAPATAALGTVAVADLLIALVLTAALAGSGLALADAAAFGIGVGLTGLVFAALAAVTAQVAGHARAASGLAMAGLGVAFLVRGIGDVITPTGSLLSWCSPIAWAQQTRMFVDLRWWPLGLSVFAVLALLGLAVRLAHGRDHGLGLLAERPGPAAAGAGLRTAVGLPVRLLRGSAAAWGIGIVVTAVVFGSLAAALKDMIATNPQIAIWVGAGTGDGVAQLARAYGSAMLGFLAIAVGGFLVSAVLRLRAEEETGRLELLLTGAGRARSRVGLLLGWWLVVLAAGAVLLALAGLGLGAGVSAALGGGVAVGPYLGAALAYLPALAVLAGVALVLFAAIPRATAAAWVLVAWTAVVGWLGPLLHLPAWASGLSPVHHVPQAPAHPLTWAAVPVLTALALALTALAAAAFRRRSIPS